jgi:hypothetical protein
VTRGIQPPPQPCFNICFYKRNTCRGATSRRACTARARLCRGTRTSSSVGGENGERGERDVTLAIKALFRVTLLSFCFRTLLLPFSPPLVPLTLPLTLPLNATTHSTSASARHDAIFIQHVFVVINVPLLADETAQHELIYTMVGLCRLNQVDP